MEKKNVIGLKIVFKALKRNASNIFSMEMKICENLQITMEHKKKQ